MTDPLPPTDLGEIVVTGQRRSSPATSFPVGGGGGSPDEQLEIGEDPDSGGGERPNPQCTDPEARRIWNADASAATAGREFLDRAATLGDNPPLGIREFGAALILQPDDPVTLGPVEWGEPGVPGQVPGVTIDTTGVTNQNWMAMFIAIRAETACRAKQILMGSWIILPWLNKQVEIPTTLRCI